MREKFLRFAGIKVTVLGFSRTGKAVSELMRDLGANVFISEFGNPEELKNTDFDFEVGGHTKRALDCDLLIPSPGIKPSAKIIQDAYNKGIEVRGEIDFAAELLPCDYVSVTGTSGKSTTTSLIAQMLTKAGIISFPIGNIGDPVSNYVLNAEPDWVPVIEVGSPMCEMMDSFHPRVAVFLNLSEDHLDRHGTMEVYAAMKEKILRFMTEDDLIVLNSSDEWSRSLSKKSKAKSLFFAANPDDKADAFMDGDSLYIHEEKVAVMDDFVLNGAFNGQNILAAALAVSHFGIDMKNAVSSVSDFHPLKHRMQFVGEWGGVRFINDSKATKPDATVLALKTLSGPFILILGGSEKGSDFSELPNNLSDVKLVIIHGKTSERLKNVFDDAGFSRYRVTTNQSEAIRTAIEEACSGDSVLLSPACASFDQFKDFEERGDVFALEVKEIAPKILGS
ncbi:MAG: UDP-N-acetylmuramoyl-L-alanine--D-glutamate ligase [Caldisericia bacterium]